MDYRIQDKNSNIRWVQALLGATKSRLDVDQTKPISEQLRKLSGFINTETLAHENKLKEILIHASITALFGMYVYNRSTITSVLDVIKITATAPALTWNQSWKVNVTVLMLMAFGPSNLCPLCWASDLMAYLVILCLIVYLVSVIFSSRKISKLTIARMHLAEQDTRLTERFQ